MSSNGDEDDTPPSLVQNPSLCTLRSGIPAPQTVQYAADTEGDIVPVLGASGSGKTWTGRVLTGFGELWGGQTYGVLPPRLVIGEDFSLLDSAGFLAGWDTGAYVQMREQHCMTAMVCLDGSEPSTLAAHGIVGFIKTNHPHSEIVLCLTKQDSDSCRISGRSMQLQPEMVHRLEEEFGAPIHCVSAGGRCTEPQGFDELRTALRFSLAGRKHRMKERAEQRLNAAMDADSLDLLDSAIPEAEHAGVGAQLITVARAAAKRLADLHAKQIMEQTDDILALLDSDND